MRPSPAVHMPATVLPISDLRRDAVSAVSAVTTHTLLESNVNRQARLPSMVLRRSPTCGRSGQDHRPRTRRTSSMIDVVCRIRRSGRDRLPSSTCPGATCGQSIPAELYPTPACSQCMNRLTSRRSLCSQVRRLGCESAQTCCLETKASSCRQSAHALAASLGWVKLCAD